MNRLSAVEVAASKKPGVYPDGGGLYLQVGKTGSKSWIFRFAVDGRERYMGLGPLHTISLARAREKAREAREARIDGKDPLKLRQDERDARKLEAAKLMTFNSAAEGYIKAHEGRWHNAKHRWQWSTTLEQFVLPTLGKLPVQEIDVGLVLKAIEPIWTTKPETASRVRGRVERILDWAAARGHRTGANPARWQGHLEHLLPGRDKVAGTTHYAALPYSEIASFMADLNQRESIAARALEFAILTAGRTSEVLGARWDEVSTTKHLWVVPPERMKTKREHRVPLSEAALTVLERVAAVRQDDFIFPGQKAQKPLSSMSMLMLLRRMGRADLTAHGFRSTFRDWAAEQTSFPSELAEMALAHTVSDKVEAAYRRGDMFQRRRQLAEAWSRYCDGLPAKDNNVIHFDRHSIGAA
jgi:integrase